jgi:hypothetical protein
MSRETFKWAEFVHGIASVRGLQIEDDIAFRRREWRMERAGWAALALFVGAAAAGAFGGGPLSRASAVDASGHLVIRYERFVRASAPTELRLQISPAAAHDGEVHLWAEPAYFQNIEISSVVPEPARVEQRGPHLVYAFPVTHSVAPFEISLRVKPTTAGRHSGQFGVSGESAAVVRQFAYF